MPVAPPCLHCWSVPPDVLIFSTSCGPTLIAYFSAPRRALCGVIYVPSRFRFFGPVGGLVCRAARFGVFPTMPGKNSRCLRLVWPLPMAFTVSSCEPCAPTNNSWLGESPFRCVVLLAAASCCGPGASPLALPHAPPSLRTSFASSSPLWSTCWLSCALLGSCIIAVVLCCWCCCCALLHSPRGSSSFRGRVALC